MMRRLYSSLKGVAVDPKVRAHIDRLGVGKRRARGRRGSGGRRQGTVPRKHDPRRQARAVAGASEVVERILRQRYGRPVSVSGPEEEFPPAVLPEVAFAGRSNVGKSSLLAALSVRHVSARAEDRPGTTRSVDFFFSRDLLTLVDLPGYGFAYANADDKRRWSTVMARYLATRDALKRVLVLVDARVGVKASDQELFTFLSRTGVRFQVVLTKTDLVVPDDLARRVVTVRDALRSFPVALSDVALVSSRTFAGVPQFCQSLASIVQAEHAHPKEANKK